LLIAVNTRTRKIGKFCAMSAELNLLAERSVPRYTSYPTAPHFHAGIGSDVYASWLETLPPRAALSLYLHVPFCRELCHYCGCHTKAMRQRAPVDDYARALKDEIGVVGRLLHGQPVSHWHWGGGTPSMLTPDQFLELCDELARHVDVGAVREHAIELDPRYVTAELVAGLIRIGVNRASLGVQDLAPDVQRAIGRIQPYEMVARAVEMLRGGGIDAINFDLIYGLPRQTVEGVRETAERSCALKPARVALFGYAHVPWFKKQQRLINAAELPGLHARLAQMEAAQEVFLAHGYRAIGIDHFAAPDDSLAKVAANGALRRNFQGYTTDNAVALIGLGASAIGRMPQGFVQNAPDVGGYARAVSSGQPATVRGIELGEEDRRRGAIIERLMCDMRIDLRNFAAGDPAVEFYAERAALQPYAAEGLVVIEPSQVIVTAKGKPYLRLIAAAFDTYLAAGKATHSRAV
jgi:oxygen-independent coproporphyrinogen-3 oxidase